MESISGHDTLENWLNLSKKLNFEIRCFEVVETDNLFEKYSSIKGKKVIPLASINTIKLNLIKS